MAFSFCKKKISMLYRLKIKLVTSSTPSAQISRSYPYPILVCVPDWIRYTALFVRVKDTTHCTALQWGRSGRPLITKDPAVPRVYLLVELQTLNFPQVAQALFISNTPAVLMQKSFTVQTPETTKRREKKQQLHSMKSLFYPFTLAM